LNKEAKPKFCGSPSRTFTKKLFGAMGDVVHYLVIIDCYHKKVSHDSTFFLVLFVGMKLSIGQNLRVKFVVADMDM